MAAIVCLCLAEAETEVMEGGRKLLCFAGNCVRPLATVQNHKVRRNAH